MDPIFVHIWRLFDPIFDHIWPIWTLLGPSWDQVWVWSGTGLWPVWDLLEANIRWKFHENYRGAPIDHCLGRGGDKCPPKPWGLNSWARKKMVSGPSKIAFFWSFLKVNSRPCFFDFFGPPPRAHLRGLGAKLVPKPKIFRKKWPKTEKWHFFAIFWGFFGVFSHFFCENLLRGSKISGIFFFSSKFSRFSTRSDPTRPSRP